MVLGEDSVLAKYLVLGEDLVLGKNSVLGKRLVLGEDSVLWHETGLSPGEGGLSAPRWRLLGVRLLVYAVVSKELGLDMWPAASSWGTVCPWAYGTREGWRT